MDAIVRRLSALTHYGSDPMSFTDKPIHIHIPREREVPDEQPLEEPAPPVEAPVEPEKVPAGADQALNF